MTSELIERGSDNRLTAEEIAKRLGLIKKINTYPMAINTRGEQYTHRQIREAGRQLLADAKMLREALRFYATVETDIDAWQPPHRQGDAARKALAATEYLVEVE